MSRQESDREDLMREATALWERAEFRIPGEDDSIVAGFRSTGALAIYFGQDPVYQFDESGRLRRAFVNGALFRSQHDTLARMLRDRTDHQVVLRRTDLTESELAEFRSHMLDRLTRLRTALDHGQVTDVTCLPPNHDVPARVGEFLKLPLALSSDEFLSCQIRARQ